MCCLMVGENPFPVFVELSLAIAWEKNNPFVNTEEIIMVENRDYHENVFYTNFVF